MYLSKMYHVMHNVMQDVQCHVRTCSKCTCTWLFMCVHAVNVHVHGYSCAAVNVHEPLRCLYTCVTSVHVHVGEMSQSASVNLTLCQLHYVYLSEDFDSSQHGGSLQQLRTAPHSGFVLLYAHTQSENTCSLFSADDAAVPYPL